MHSSYSCSLNNFKQILRFRDLGTDTLDVARGECVESQAERAYFDFHLLAAHHDT